MMTNFVEICRANTSLRKPLRRSLFLGWLCLATAGAAAADAPLPSVTIPLSVQFNRQSSISFLYASLAAPSSQDGLKAVQGPRRTAFGFKNSVALAQNALHLNGSVYFADKPGMNGAGGQARALSQALSYGHNAWKLDAHFQSVGEDFAGADSLTDSRRLQDQRGHDEIGFAAARTDPNGNFGLSLLQNEDTVSHLKTETQSLSFGHTLSQGLRFDAGREVMRNQPAGSAQTSTATHLSLDWETHKTLSLQAHWAETGVYGSTPQDSRQQDLTATFTVPDPKHLGTLRHTQAIIHLAQSLAQGKMQTNIRALSFDTDLTDTHVGLEVTNCRTTGSGNMDTMTSRSLRVANISPGDWLHYSAYYKQRQHSLGGRITDIREYEVRVPLHRLALSYHYLNGSEQGGGGVLETVDTRYQIGGPLYRTLSWNIQYDQSNNFAGTAGVENFLLGIQGILGPGQSLQFELGRPEQRYGGDSFVGRSYQLAYECKVNSSDTLAFNGEMTSWVRKSSRTATPPTTAKVRLNLAKAF